MTVVCFFGRLSTLILVLAPITESYFGLMVSPNDARNMRQLKGHNSIQTSLRLKEKAKFYAQIHADQKLLTDSSKELTSRRVILGNIAFGGFFFVATRSAFAEEATDSICTNILGCPIPGGKLKPPKKVYKDIFEEERDLARQAAERAEQERAEKRRSEILVVRAQFAVVKKGLAEMKKDIDAALIDVQRSADNQTAWDDLRRFSRLYDTALRKDGIDLALNNIRRIKAQFDVKAGEEAANAVTEALKGLDRAGKKKDVDLSKTKFSEAVQAVESWLKFESQLESN